jgi:hypothetical protein
MTGKNVRPGPAAECISRKVAPEAELENHQS